MLGHAAGNPLFLFQVQRLARAVGGVHRARLDPYTAMHAPDTPIIGQGIQVAPDGLGRYRKMFGQLLDAHVTMLAHQLDNGILAILLVHKPGLFVIG